MLLVELGDSISDAIQRIISSATVDKDKKTIIVNNCLNDITHALLRADVQFHLVRKIHINVSRIINSQHTVSDRRWGLIIIQAIFDELCKMFDPGELSLIRPKKGKLNVIMFVGSQWSNKTVLCAKYAYYHQKRGWKVAIVCTNPFGTRAFVQLKQYATKANISFYPSMKEEEEELDPIKIAVQGVDTFKENEEGFDLIIVDTRSPHKQEQENAPFFEETRRVSEIVKPNLVVLVSDTSVGQASAFHQARSFQHNIPVAGAVILTNLHGFANASSLGALSAIAAAKCPIIFTDTGEEMTELEAFDARHFVCSRLVGDSVVGSLKKIHKAAAAAAAASMDKQLDDIEPTFTLRIMYEQLKRILNLPSSELLSMMPFPSTTSVLLPSVRGGENEAKIKRFMAIMDSMTNNELDSSNPMLHMKEEESRVIRIARGSGRKVSEVREVLKEHELLVSIVKRVKKLNKFDSTFPGCMHGRWVVFIFQLFEALRFMDFDTSFLNRY